MKKIFSIVLILLTAITIAACGGGTDKPDSQPENKTATITLKTPAIKIQKDQVLTSEDILKGVTAKIGDADATANLVVEGLDKVVFSNAGTSQVVKIKLVKDNVELKTAQIVIVIEGSQSTILLKGPDAITYYTDTVTAADIEKEFSASSIDGTEKYDVKLISKEGSDYSLSVASTYTIEIQASNPTDESNKITKNVKLTILDSSEINIPETLEKNTAANPIKISLWHSNGDTISKKLEQYGKDFSKMMLDKYGVHVVVTLTKNGSNYDELRKNVINAIQGGEVPNIVQNYPDHVVEYNNNNIILSLTPYIHHKTHGYKVSDPKDNFNDILQSYRDENRSSNANGDLLSLPFNKSTEVIVYNRDLFKQVLKTDKVEENFPKTWQDLFALAPEILKLAPAEIDKIAAKYLSAGQALPAPVEKIKEKYVPFTYDSTANAFITLLRQWGGQYTELDKNGKGKILFDNDTTQTMLKYFGSHNKVFTTPKFWEANYASTQFQGGYTSFASGSTGGVRYNTPIVSLKSGTGIQKLFNIGVSPMLYSKDTPQNRTVIQQGTNLSITKNKDPQKQLMSWYFLKYLTSHEIQLDFSLATGYSPIRDSVYTAPKYLEYLKKADLEILDTMTKDEAEAVVKAKAAKIASDQRHYHFFDTPFIGSSAAREAVGTAFERIILNTNLTDLDIQKAINAAKEEAEKVLK